MERNLILKAIAAASVAVLIGSIRRRRSIRWKNRRWWVRPWISRRSAPSSTVYDLVHDELREEDPESFKNYLRMDEAAFRKLLHLVDPLISRQNTNLRESISAERRLTIALRFLATGESYTSLSYSHRIPKSTISGIIPEVCQTIYSVLKENYMQVPRNPDEWKKISNEFLHLWNFPNIVGAMDGKHILFRPPRIAGSFYRNYKGSDSIVLLAVVDANYKFLYVDAGCNGSRSDGGVFLNSSLHNAIATDSLNLPCPSPLPGTRKLIPYMIVADAAFQLHPRVMKPYPDRGSDNEKRIFNYRLSRARRVVENAFGILSNRFRIFLTTINLPASTVQQIVLASCALHNFIITECGYSYTADVDVEDTEAVTFQPGKWREGKMLQSIIMEGGNRSSREAQIIRDTLKDYFNNVGFVPWQWEAVKKFNF